MHLDCTAAPAQALCAGAQRAVAHMNHLGHKCYLRVRRGLQHVLTALSYLVCSGWFRRQEEGTQQQPHLLGNNPARDTGAMRALPPCCCTPLFDVPQDASEFPGPAVCSIHICLGQIFAAAQRCSAISLCLDSPQTLLIVIPLAVGHTDAQLTRVKTGTRFPGRARLVATRVVSCNAEFLSLPFYQIHQQQT